MNSADVRILANLHHAVIAARRMRRSLALPRVDNIVVHSGDGPARNPSFDVFMRALSRLTHDDAALVADLVASAVVAIVRAAQTHSGNDASFSSVAKAAARSAVADHLYRSTSCVSVTSHARKSRVQLSRVPIDHVTLVQPSANAASANVYSEQLHALINAPDVLDTDDRDLISLHLAGTSQREIGRQLGVPQRTVCDRLHRATARLRNAAERTLTDAAHAQ